VTHRQGDTSQKPYIFNSKDLGLTLRKEVKLDSNVDLMSGIISMLPPPEILQAVGMLIPKIMRTSNKLSKEFIPKTSILAPLYEDDDAPFTQSVKPVLCTGSQSERRSKGEDEISSNNFEKNTNNNKKDKVHLAQHQIDTPFGSVHIKSMIGTYQVPKNKKYI
jgi:hypothetical protein